MFSVEKGKGDRIPGVLSCCEGFVGAVGSWTSMMSPAGIACQSCGETRGRQPVPNVEKTVISEASSTSSPTPPTKTVRFVFVPSSMWPEGGSGRENDSTFLGSPSFYQLRRRWAQRQHQRPANRKNDPNPSRPPSPRCPFQTNSNGCSPRCAPRLMEAISRTPSEHAIKVRLIPAILFDDPHFTHCNCKF